MVKPVLCLYAVSLRGVVGTVEKDLWWNHNKFPSCFLYNYEIKDSSNCSCHQDFIKGKNKEGFRWENKQDYPFGLYAVGKFFYFKESRLTELLLPGALLDKLATCVFYIPPSVSLWAIFCILWSPGWEARGVHHYSPLVCDTRRSCVSAKGVVLRESELKAFDDHSGICRWIVWLRRSWWMLVHNSS